MPACVRGWLSACRRADAAVEIKGPTALAGPRKAGRGRAHLTLIGERRAAAPVRVTIELIPVVTVCCERQIVSVWSSHATSRSAVIQRVGRVQERDTAQQRRDSEQQERASHEGSSSQHGRNAA